VCTLVVAHAVVPGHPLVVVANRDEDLRRPSRPPFRWPEGFVAPRDEVAGGTWLGFTPSGLFVGITNRFRGGTDKTRASRGGLVTDALGHASAKAVHASMAAVDPARYNGFHLVYADAEDAFATVSDGKNLAQLRLGHGLHLVTERSFGAGSDRSRVERIRAAWERLDKDPQALTGLLTEHDPAAPFEGSCLHVGALGYGTRSSLVLAVPVTPAAPRMLWAEGPPCTTPFVNVDLASHP
jgi:uncharacterized protein with NRDE domain